MFTVINVENGEHQCECVSFGKAVMIAQALQQTMLDTPRMAVLRGDEEVYDTRNGYTFG